MSSLLVACAILLNHHHHPFIQLASSDKGLRRRESILINCNITFDIIEPRIPTTMLLCSVHSFGKRVLNCLYFRAISNSIKK